MDLSQNVGFDELGICTYQLDEDHLHTNIPHARELLADQSSAFLARTTPGLLYKCVARVMRQDEFRANLGNTSRLVAVTSPRPAAY